jgi:ParB-like chromosome segregation protein Spo0J
MSTPVKPAFELAAVDVKLEKLLPTKKLAPAVKNTEAYADIAASAAVVGIIEPLVVHRQRGGTFLVLDGHLRLDVLKGMGATQALCLISTDDETYTYNAHVNRIAPIQANRMILKTVEAGVDEAKLSKALNLTRHTLRESRTMLKDICPEAIELLKDKHVAIAAFRLFKQVKPLRQIEMADLMIAAATYTKAYAEALVIATPRANLVDPVKSKRSEATRPEDVAKMQTEMQALEREVLLLDESYGRNVVNLTIARGYLKKILENVRVVRYLASKFPDLLAQFQRIQETASLEG